MGEPHWQVRHRRRRHEETETSYAAPSHGTTEPGRRVESGRDVAEGRDSAGTGSGSRRSRADEAARGRAAYPGGQNDWREHTQSWEAEPDTSSWVRDPDTGQWSRAEDDPRIQAWRREAARREATGDETRLTGRQEAASGPGTADTGRETPRGPEPDDDWRTPPRGGSGFSGRARTYYHDGPGVVPRSMVPYGDDSGPDDADDSFRGDGQRRVADEPRVSGRRRAMPDRGYDEGPVGPDVWGRDPESPPRRQNRKLGLGGGRPSWLLGEPSAEPRQDPQVGLGEGRPSWSLEGPSAEPRQDPQVGLGEGRPSWSLDEPSPEGRQRLEPGGWRLGERAPGAGYRESGGGDWRRGLADQSDLVETESRRFRTSDFTPFRSSGAAAVPPSSNLSMTSTSLIPPVRERESLLRSRPGSGFQTPSGSYERRPVTGAYPTVRRSDLLDPEDEEDDQETGGPLAAVGYTVIWYGVPVVLFMVYMLVVSTTGSSQTRGLDTLASAAPQFGVSLVLSIAVAVGLRKVSTSWKAISVGLAAAVVGGGLATVLSSAITGNSLS